MAITLTQMLLALMMSVHAPTAQNSRRKRRVVMNIIAQVDECLQI